MSNHQASFKIRVLRQDNHFVEVIIDEDDDFPMYARMDTCGSVIIQSNPFDGQKPLKKWEIGSLDQWIPLLQALQAVEKKWRNS